MAQDHVHHKEFNRSNNFLAHFCAFIVLECKIGTFLMKMGDAKKVNFKSDDQLFLHITHTYAHHSTLLTFFRESFSVTLASQQGSILTRNLNLVSSLCPILPILCPFCVYFMSSFGPNGAKFGSISSPFLVHFWSILVQFGHIFCSFFVYFLSIFCLFFVYFPERSERSERSDYN